MGHEMPQPESAIGAAIPDVRAGLPGIDLQSEPVIIVGAGPVGMTAALMLAHYGIRSRILDDDNKLSYGSRAIAIHRCTLEVWEKLGCVAPMLEKGLAWQMRRTFFRDTELFSQAMPLPAPDRLPTFINLQQCHTEAFLLESIQSTGLIDIVWLHKVVGLRQDADGVTLDVKTMQGTETWRSPYVLGCDGARSNVRKLLDIPFPGTTHRDHFLIADIRADLPFPGEPRFFFDPPSNRGRTLLIHPQPDNVWRLDWQLPPDTDLVAEYKAENLDRRIRAVIGDEVDYKLVWVSDYRFHQRLVPQFRQGRAFLLGDAAHLVAPFGARGMNSGVQDVENLCWKLRLVLTGQAPDSLLDTYHAERWPVQRLNQQVTQATMRFLVPPTRRELWRRNLILRASRRLPALRRYVNSGKMVTAYPYHRSPILARDLTPALLRRWVWGTAPALGARVPDAACQVGLPAAPRATTLRQLLGANFVALLFVADVAGARACAQAFAGQTLPATLYLVSSDPTAALLPLPPGVRLLGDPDGALARMLAAKPGSFYLIRPDSHLAARRRRIQPGDIGPLVNAARDPGYAPANGRTPQPRPLLSLLTSDPSN